MVREATRDDLKWLTLLWTEWFAEDPPPFHSAKYALGVQLKAFRLALESGIALVVPHEAALLWGVGNPGDLYDMGLFVRKPYRAKGLGVTLMARAAQLAKERGFERVFISPLDTNPRSGEWLARNGYNRFAVSYVKEL